jgi:hypothetical protein
MIVSPKPIDCKDEMESIVYNTTRLNPEVLKR